jgi:AraC-like DNA-binding protein
VIANSQCDVPQQSFRERLAHPALGEFVSSVFIHEVAPGSASYESRNVPESVEIVYRVGSATPLVAHPLEPLVKTAAPGSSFVGLLLRHGAANRVLGVPASDLAGRSEGLERVWGQVAEAIGSRLMEATTLEDAAARLEAEIIRRCAEAPPPDPIVRELVRRLRPWRDPRLTTETLDLFVSPRQLRRRCRDALGFGPKTLHRVLRFQVFFALVDYRAEGDNLSQLAMRAGFTDQAHLTRECMRVTGLTPRAFMADRLRTCAGLHDHSVSFAHLRPVLGPAGVGMPRPRRTFRSSPIRAGHKS